MTSLDDIDRLTGGRLGTFDVSCPICGPHRSTPANRRKRVLRVWRSETGFAGYNCVHCGERGHVLERNGKPVDPARLAEAIAKAAERDRSFPSARPSSWRRPTTCSVWPLPKASRTDYRCLRILGWARFPQDGNRCSRGIRRRRSPRLLRITQMVFCS
jgi:hypothetical protein